MSQPNSICTLARTTHHSICSCRLWRCVGTVADIQGTGGCPSIFLTNHLHTLHYALPIHCRHCDDPVSLIKHLQYMSDITSEHSAAAAQQHALRQCIVSHTDAVVAPASVLTHRNRRGFVQQILATCTNTVPVLSTQHCVECALGLVCHMLCRWGSGTPDSCDPTPWRSRTNRHHLRG
jgi:hypothetical protein